MFEQTKINALFKSTKQTSNASKEAKVSGKRKAEFSIEEEAFVKLKGDSTKRIKLECEKEEDYGSKSTLCTSHVCSPLNQFELSSKTKGIIDKLLLKKSNAKLNDTKRKSHLPDNNHSILPFLQGRQKEKEPRFSVESKEEIKQPLSLSDKAKEVILRLKQDKLERMNRFLRKPLKDNTRSDSSFSLKFKYEDLLKNKRELLLPPQYKTIFNAFVALDQTINVFKISSCEKMPTFQLIKETIEQCTYRKFDLKIFKQILYVVPHLYIYYYCRKANKEEGEGRYEMVIDIPSDYNERLNSKDFGAEFDFNTIQTPKELKAITSPLSMSDINKRKEVFKNILLELVNKKHEEFLIEKKHHYFNPFNVKTWHHDFDLSTCEEIPLFQIEPAPDDNNNQLFSFENAIKNNKIKEKLISEALDNISKDSLNNKDKNDDATDDDKSTQQLRGLVSDTFIKKLKAKEAAIKLSKEILDYSSVNNALKEKQMILNEILLQIKSLFIVHAQTKKSYELNHLVELLYHSSTILKRSSSIDDIRSLISSISKKYPELISLRQHSSMGTIVIMNTKIDIPSDITID